MPGEMEFLAQHDWDCLTLGEWKRLQSVITSTSPQPVQPPAVEAEAGILETPKTVGAIPPMTRPVRPLIRLPRPELVQAQPTSTPRRLIRPTRPVSTSPPL
jgi:hypothetical protein